MALQTGSISAPARKPKEPGLSTGTLRLGKPAHEPDRKPVRTPKQAPDIIGGYCPYCGVPPGDHPAGGCVHIEKVINASAVMYRRISLMLDLMLSMDPGARRNRLLKLHQEAGQRLAFEMQLPEDLIIAIHQLELQFKRFAESK